MKVSINFSIKCHLYVCTLLIYKLRCFTFVVAFFFQEAVEAYKNQNQFLSTELLEMNQLRSDDLAVNKQLVQLV